MLLDHLDGALAGFDVDARGGVGEPVAGHGVGLMRSIISGSSTSFASLPVISTGTG